MKIEILQLLKYLWKDQNWDYIQKEKPIDEYVDYFYKPFVWALYDDLHKNIKDPEKYIWIDEELFNEILEQKPEIKIEINKNKKFEILKSKIKNNDNQRNLQDSTNFVKTSIHINNNNEKF